MEGNSIEISWADWRQNLAYQRYLAIKDRSRRLRAQFFSVLTLVSGCVYLCWLAGQTYWSGQLHAYIFLAAESLAYFLLFLLGFNIWRLCFHRPEGLKAPGSYSVDVFITCCGEPLPVIQTTLAAVKNLDYESYQVYVLDDSGLPALATLAQALGFHYHSRLLEGWPITDSKSGNLNFGLSLSKGEIILVLDADQVPRPDIISRMIGFFTLPRVAYVQSQQSFFLPEDDPFFNRDEIFYEIIQVSNDQANAVISCGSGVLYRRQALEELGGFATWNIVEDLTTAYELVSRGWKGIYFPYILSRGLAPETLRGVYRQRFQWCLDAMRVFFWDNPLIKKGLNLTQRLHFLIIMVTYLISGLVLPIFYAIPLYCYYKGISFLQGQEWAFLLIRGGYLLLTILSFRYLFFKKAALKQFKILCGLFPVYALGILAALWYLPGRKPLYRPNNVTPGTASGSAICILPHLGIIFLHLALPFISIYYGWAPLRLIATNALFSAFTIWVLGEMVILGLRKPQWSPSMDPRLVYGFES
ncbi:MAG: glycosyltransferase [Deltaproteobacteria bacterium]|nr:glycosyltransferase [Deltaproteobacteria bacterium]MBW1952596.1 glycosyltransferase [Deltaproteobacteria bacterium]MBW1987157.1 glycosyltransferase [Deltaproteobacteria bacterium]MBW2133911.1 glycosyltransferase [Deltaproteobacteria bacterium]